MSQSVSRNYVDTSFVSCKQLVRKTLDNFVTDKNKVLITASIWNAAAAVFVSYSALKTDNYNPREWWSDVAVHVLNSATCAAHAITPNSAPDSIKAMLDTATKATKFANKARLAVIAVSVGYNTQTIPGIPEAIDVGNHGLTLAVLEKYGS